MIHLTVKITSKSDNPQDDFVKALRLLAHEVENGTVDGNSLIVTEQYDLDFDFLDEDMKPIGTSRMSNILQY